MAGIPDQCPDGGTCHHPCLATECFRVQTCEPLSGVFPGDEWPERVKARFARGRKSDGSFSIGSDVWPGASKLMEECGELIQVLGKLIATHGDIEHWEGDPLDQRLMEEIADVRAAIEFFVANNPKLEVGTIFARYSNKFHLFSRWHEEQRA